MILRNEIYKTYKPISVCYSHIIFKMYLLPIFVRKNVITITFYTIEDIIS